MPQNQWEEESKPGWEFSSLYLKSCALPIAWERNWECPKAKSVSYREEQESLHMTPNIKLGVGEDPQPHQTTSSP